MIQKGVFLTRFIVRICHVGPIARGREHQCVVARHAREREAHGKGDSGEGRRAAQGVNGPVRLVVEVKREGVHHEGSNDVDGDDLGDGKHGLGKQHGGEGRGPRVQVRGRRQR